MHKAYFRVERCFVDCYYGQDKGVKMAKSEKLNVIEALIKRANALTYDVRCHPESPVVDDALSFVRNALEEKNRIEWAEQIKSIKWGVFFENAPGYEEKRAMQWQNGRIRLIELLESIKQEIELYTSETIGNFADLDNTTCSDSIIFISHSSSDILYGNALKKFITGLGVKREQLIYTSHPMHKIPLDANIFDYLRKNINKKIFMIFLFSDNYFNSPACLNEMGAAWVIQNDYTSIFTPNFDFENPKYLGCAIDIRKMGIVLNGNDLCKTSMIEFKKKILSLFELFDDEIQSSHLIEEFINEIIELNQMKSNKNQNLKTVRKKSGNRLSNKQIRDIQGIIL